MVQVRGRTLMRGCSMKHGLRMTTPKTHSGQGELPELLATGESHCHACKRICSFTAARISFEVTLAPAIQRCHSPRCLCIHLSLALVAAALYYQACSASLRGSCKFLCQPGLLVSGDNLSDMRHVCLHLLLCYLCLEASCSLQAQLCFWQRTHLNSTS